MLLTAEFGECFHHGGIFCLFMYFLGGGGGGGKITPVSVLLEKSVIPKCIRLLEPKDSTVMF